MCRLKHVEPLKNFGIINSITKLHLVGISTEFSVFLGIKCVNTEYPEEIFGSGECVGGKKIGLERVF